MGESIQERALRMAAESEERQIRDYDECEDGRFVMADAAAEHMANGAQSTHIVQGKPLLSENGMQMLLKKSGHLLEFSCHVVSLSDHFEWGESGMLHIYATPGIQDQPSHYYIKAVLDCGAVAIEVRSIEQILEMRDRSRVIAKVWSGHFDQMAFLFVRRALWTRLLKAYGIWCDGTV